VQISKEELFWGALSRSQTVAASCGLLQQHGWEKLWSFTIQKQNPQQEVKVLLKVYLKQVAQSVWLRGRRAQKKKKKKKKNKPCLWQLLQAYQQIWFHTGLNNFSYLTSRKQNGVCCNLFLQTHNTNYSTGTAVQPNSLRDLRFGRVKSTTDSSNVRCSCPSWGLTDSAWCKIVTL